MANLTFNIESGRLSGEIEGVKINTFAASGGRGGTKTKDAEIPMLVNNVFYTKVKRENNKSKTVGGSIPLGEYVLGLRKDPKTGKVTKNWVRLNPRNAAQVQYMQFQGRDGMAIHGRGPRGSDGCIVPLDTSVVPKIFSIVEELETSGKPLPTLKVIAVGTFDLTERWTRIG